MKSKISLIIVFTIIINLFNFSYATEIQNFQTENVEQLSTPEVFADSAILLDVDSNKILYEKNSNNIMYPASTTKLMTAILVAEKCPDLSEKANVSYYAVNSVPISYATAHLVTGEQISIKDLLYALLVPSANDAAYVLAQYLANNGNNYPVDNTNSSKTAFENSITTFSEMMNSKAKELGCTNTNFVNPNGIHNENHHTTSYDLMLIGRYAYQNSTLRTICKTIEYTLENTNKYTSTPRKLETTNLLITPDEKGYYANANGLKTGFTDPAQSCIIASANKDNRNLIAVILHSEETKDETKTRESDCKRLFEYGFNYFSYTTLAGENSVIQTMNIFNGSSETRNLDVLCAKELKTLIIHGQIIDATPEIVIDKKYAPISKGETIGSITYNINGETFTSDLIADHDVESINYLFYIGTILIILIIITIVYVVLLKRAKRKRRNRKKY
ncbi:MAG: D-alanyl-D-alanine carboxypeptidase [Clostridia bacterium]|nr:D-alanyl-D-alanine carboxypeptidase [Bacilli bacterium]MBR3324796.1 D-alanyl-D-alanine carboxypeptidase [Clostridia bacterium]